MSLTLLSTARPELVEGRVANGARGSTGSPRACRGTRRGRHWVSGSCQLLSRHGGTHPRWTRNATRRARMRIGLAHQGMIRWLTPRYDTLADKALMEYD